MSFMLVYYVVEKTHSGDDEGLLSVPTDATFTNTFFLVRMCSVFSNGGFHGMYINTIPQLVVMILYSFHALIFFTK
jgi:hypothetical protein